MSLLSRIATMQAGGAQMPQDSTAPRSAAVVASKMPIGRQKCRACSSLTENGQVLCGAHLRTLLDRIRTEILR